MATEPDQIRQEIEATRSELAADVDRLADKTSPKRIAERRWDGVKSAVRRTSDRVMGASSQAGGSVQSSVSGAQDRVQGAAHTAADKAQSAASTIADKAQDAADAARQAPAAVTRQTQGNPLAVGLIAFGAGLLAASLLPKTEAERRAGEQLADQAGQYVEPLKETAQQVGADLKDRALEAVGEVKETAQHAVANTKEQASESGKRAVQDTKESVTS